MSRCRSLRLSAGHQEREELPGEDLGDQDVGDVLLALDDHDARVG